MDKFAKKNDMSKELSALTLSPRYELTLSAVYVQAEAAGSGTGVLSLEKFSKIPPDFLLIGGDSLS
jgi:hypothetical protein